MELQAGLRNIEFFRDVEQVELKTMPFEPTVAPPTAAPIQVGRNVKVGRNVTFSPYNLP